MKFENVKKEISRIAKINSPEECQKELRNLDYELNKRMKIKRIERGFNWVYYYKILGYKSNGSENLAKKPLGKISSEFYNKHKEFLEMLRKEGNLEDLKFYMY